jgi:hypothetical protein
LLIDAAWSRTAIEGERVSIDDGVRILKSVGTSAAFDERSGGGWAIGARMSVGR